MSHVYFHVDLNAFFASAEEILNPDLKDKPIVVSGTSRRSVISTANYKARTYGIHSAQPLSEAMNLCKDLVICEPHFSWYTELSNKFMNIIYSYTDEVEQASIDECYVDMTEIIKKYERPLDLAFELQRRVLQELHLPCSIGVAPNMFLAKMASDLKKPMGITVIRLREVESKLWPLPIQDMRGVGEKTVPYLLDLNIHTIGDLANCQDIEALRPIFGKNTDSMLERAHGIDHRTIVKEFDSKSIGVSETFLDDITDYDELRGMVRLLSRKLSSRLKSDHKSGSLLNVRIKYFDFQNTTKSIQLDSPIYKSDDIFVHAIDLFDQHWNNDPVRLLGISLSNFQDNDIMQLNLFTVEQNDTDISSLLKELNHSIGSTQFIRASEMVREEK